MSSFFSWLSRLFGRLQTPRTSGVDVAEVLVHETQSFPETLARIAEAEVARGVREEGGNNRGRRIVEYQTATWLAPDAWPWCAAFVCWCILEALQVLALKPTTWKRPRTASAYDFERWATGEAHHPNNSGWGLLSRKQTPKRGDLVTFRWSHIGIVLEYDSKRQMMTVAEGNTFPKAERSDGGVKAPDGVYAQRRHKSTVRRLIRYHAPRMEGGRAA